MKNVGQGGHVNVSKLNFHYHVAKIDMTNSITIALLLNMCMDRLICLFSCNAFQVNFNKQVAFSWPLCDCGRCSIYL